MSMKKKVILGSVLLLLVGVMYSSYAWLTSTPAAKVNQFKFGNIEITLDEDFDADNAILYPGATIEKKPTITVSPNSENTYVYALIDNELGDDVTLNIHDDWQVVSGSVYRYKNIVEKTTAATVLPSLFTTVVVDTQLNNAEIEALASKKITIKAFAIQSETITLAQADAAAIEALK